MEWKIGELYHGFELQEMREVEEINSLARLFVHKKSGARLLHLANDDDNKVFSISFRTPPPDDTGVPHIIEHSVLCGSRKFPTKEPFVELVKGSLNTFLNAMTYPDKTMYPVASRNDKDFKNLMDVYLDAVFYPHIYANSEILMQEGWHYELEEKDGEISYKGVVYNEMKGAFSSPDAVLEQETFISLFPDTVYSRESGGDPDKIPQLTQQQFLDFHRRYYHPSNSYIFLYGDMDLLENLQFIDTNYLLNFNACLIDSEIPLQKSFTKTVVKKVDYPVAAEEKLEDKTFISLNFVTGETTDAETYLALAVLEHLLLETPAAPLKRALLDAGIGKEIFGDLTRSLRQPMLRVGVAGANEQQQDEFVQVVYRTLQKLVTEGIDKKLVEAAINIYEFSLREANFGGRPKGLIYNIKCMDSWLYDADPLLHLAYEPALAKVKAGLQSPYFEKLIEKYLLDNTHRSLVVACPKPGLAEEKAALVRQQLAAYKQNLTSTAMEELIAQTKQLKLRQETPDLAENLATIPLLDIADIKKEAEYQPLQKKQEGNAVILHHPLFTNQIVYLKLYFDTAAVPQSLLPYLFLLAEVLGCMDTEKYGYAELATEIDLHTGGFQFGAAAVSAAADDKVYYPRLVVRAKALLPKLPAMLHLLSQITTYSCFEDKKRLGELVRELKSGWDTNLFRRGQQVAVARALSYFSPAACYNEQGLLTFHQFLTILESEWEQRSAETGERLAEVANLVFKQGNLLTSVTMEEENYPQFQRHFAEFYEQLGKEPVKAAAVYNFDFTAANEGLLTSGKVQYVAKAANFRRLGHTYSGFLKVLETVMRYEYLWNRIRVQGGAYGAFAQFDRNGNMVFCSYRDPNLAETLDVYQETTRYLQNFAADEREMSKFIIGTISRLDAPLTPQMQGERATDYYLRGISQADVQRERDEVIAATATDLRAIAALVTDAMAVDNLCVLGSEEKIRSNAHLFKKLIKVIE